MRVERGVHTACFSVSVHCADLKLVPRQVAVVSDQHLELRRLSFCFYDEIREAQPVFEEAFAYLTA